MLRERLEKDMKVLGGLMVIDDLRFPNEAHMVRDLGGEVWLVRHVDSSQVPTTIRAKRE